MKVGTDGVLLGAWVNVSGEETRILDIGTGTGVIALMLAQRHPSARITGMDIDRDSVEEASANFANSRWSDRLDALLADFRCYLPDVKYDLVVSNPPYFINSLKAPDERRTTARHNDTLSHNDIISGASGLLAENGRLAVVLPAEEGIAFIDLAERQGMYLNRICRVRTKPSAPVRRLLMELSRKEVSPLEEDITIHSGNEFTDEYKALTRDFYLKF